MSGKSPAEVVNSYVQPLQQSLSCFTNGVIRPGGYDVDVLHSLTFNLPSVELLTRTGEILHFSFIQTFSIEKRVLARYKVTTRSYIYILEDAAHREILGFHWHPDTTPHIPFPHLHIYEAAGEHLRAEIRKIHFRTDRIAFEEFGLMLIDEFQVVPDREDADAILKDNCAKFKAHRSWASL